MDQRASDARGPATALDLDDRVKWSVRPIFGCRTDARGPQAATGNRGLVDDNVVTKSRRNFHEPAAPIRRGMMGWGERQDWPADWTSKLEGARQGDKSWDETRQECQD